MRRMKSPEKLFPEKNTLRGEEEVWDGDAPGRPVELYQRSTQLRVGKSQACFTDTWHEGRSERLGLRAVSLELGRDLPLRGPLHRRPFHRGSCRRNRCRRGRSSGSSSRSRTRSGDRLARLRNTHPLGCRRCLPAISHPAFHPTLRNCHGGGLSALRTSGQPAGGSGEGQRCHRTPHPSDVHRKNPPDGRLDDSLPTRAPTDHVSDAHPRRDWSAESARPAPPISPLHRLTGTTARAKATARASPRHEDPDPSHESGWQPGFESGPAATPEGNRQSIDVLSDWPSARPASWRRVCGSVSTARYFTEASTIE
jgi:hypothetical protein